MNSPKITTTLTRTVTGLLVLFACVAGGCIAFGAYFAYSALVNAHRDALESRYVISAQRVAGTAELAAALGIALPSQATLAPLVAREAELDPTIAALDITDENGTVLFSNIADRLGSKPSNSDRIAVSRPIRNDLGRQIGSATVHYDAQVMLDAQQAMAADMRKIAIPAALAACLATLLIGVLLVRRLQRAAQRAADPAHWPAAAHHALDDVQATHARVAAALGVRPS